MKRTITAITVVCILAGLISTFVFAERKANEIWMGDFMLFRIRAAAGGYSIEERVAAIQERTNVLLRERKSDIVFGFKTAGTDANIYTDDALYMTVTSADAKANNTTPMRLAEVWAGRMMRAFVKTYPDCEQCRLKKL